MSLTGMPDGPPVRSALPIADLIAGLLATQAVLLGLLQRQKTGQGDHTAVDMMQANTASLVYHATRQTLAGDAGGRLGNAHAGLVPYDAYPCSDGWVAIGCGNDRIWKRLVTALQLTSDSSLDINEQRVARRQHVDSLVATAVAGRTMADCDALFATHGVPAAPVQSVAQAVSHQTVNNITIDGRVLPGVMLNTTTTRSQHTRAPALGSDTDAVLQACGYAASDVEELRKQGVVR
jgi:crotonobetainyl-CoA:carnitine CoA-transferase CaiB-like acyl-CoA transferase